MKNNTCRKMLVIGIIILFIGASVVSSISGDIKNQDVQVKENLDNCNYSNEYEGKLEKCFNDSLEEVQEGDRSYDWPTFQHDMQRTGFTSGIGEITSPSIKWRYTGDNFHSSPAIGDIDGDGETEVIFVSSDGIYVFNGSTGDVKWSNPIRCNLRSSPAVSDVDGDGDMEVVLGADGNHTYCLDGSTGNIEWIYPIPDDIEDVRSSPAIGDVDNDGDIEVIVATLTYVYCLAGVNGNKEWEYQISSDMFYHCSPSICDVDSDSYMEIFIVGGSGTICLSGFDGSVEWSEWKYHGSLATPSLFDVDDDGDIELVCAGLIQNSGNNVFCLDAASGQEEWRFEVNDDIFDVPAVGDVDNDNDIEVIVASLDSFTDDVHCLDGATGNEEWNYTTGSSVEWESPALGDIDGDGNIEVILGCSNGRIYCLNGENGSEQWNLSLENIARYPPALGDVDDDGKLEIAIVTWNSYGGHDDRVYVLQNDFGIQPPVVVMNGPYRASTSEEILFDASESYDPDGHIVGYRWDWTNDGVWDTEWLGNPSATYSYDFAFTGLVRVEVKDNENLTTITTETVQIDETPPVTWDKTFVSGDGYSVQQTTDGGYILTGEKSEDAFLLKTDSKGNEQWIETFDGGGHHDVGRCVRKTIDGGYFVVGYPYENQGLWIIKTNSSGVLEWDHIFPQARYGLSGEQTSDGGYIATGEHRNEFMWLLKTDSDGNEEWNRTYLEENDYSIGFSVRQTSDGGYVIAGTDSGDDAVLVKTDSDGTIEWIKTYPFHYAISVNLTSDEGYVLTGWHNFLLKTDSNGNEEWNTSFGGYEGISVEETTDDGYIIGGVYTGYRACLIKTDANGTMLWRRIIEDSYCDHMWKGGADVHQTDDGYICLTSTGSDVWLIKFGPPVACYNWSDADNGGPGTVIDFDASCSWDDEEIVLYEWDWDDDGVYDYNDSDPFCSYDYGDTDPHFCTLQMSDADGYNDTVKHIVQAWVNNPPNVPSDPDPLDNATNVSVDADLSWTGGDPDPEDTVTYDVYFGNVTPPPQVSWNHTTTTFNLETLDDETTYYWQIIAWDNHDASTPGPNWSFTTEEINDPPTAPDIDGPTSGKVGVEYDYTFVSTDPEEDDIYYYVDWGDNTNTGWIGLYSSGEEITRSHTWNIESTYTIRAKAKDEHGLEGPWGTLEVEMPLDQHSINSLFFQLLERLAERFLLFEQVFSRFSFHKCTIREHLS